MATLLRSSYAGWASKVTNWFNVSVTPTALWMLAKKNTPSGSKYRVPTAPVTGPLKSPARFE
jgi:hypothetical protein